MDTDEAVTARSPYESLVYPSLLRSLQVTDTSLETELLVWDRDKPAEKDENDTEPDEFQPPLINPKRFLAKKENCFCFLG